VKFRKIHYKKTQQQFQVEIFSIEKKRKVCFCFIELVNREFIEVFAIKADERSFIGPNSTVSFPIDFTSPIAGSFQEEYTIVFDENHPEVNSIICNVLSSLVAFYLVEILSSSSIARCSCLDRKSID